MLNEYWSINIGHNVSVAGNTHLGRRPLEVRDDD